MAPSFAKEHSRPISLRRMIKMKGVRLFLLHLIKRELLRIKIAYLYHFKKTPPQKTVFLLTVQRTGSSLLQSYLNCIPNVHFGGEILSNNQPGSLRAHWLSKKSVFRHMHHFLNYLNRPVSGVKLMFPQLQMRNLSLKELSVEFPNAQWLVLYRRNIFDQYLSYQIAWLTNQWQLTQDAKRLKPDTFQIHLDVDDTLAYRDWILSSYQEILNTPELRKQSLWIAYEDLTHNPQQLFQTFVFPFLGLKSSPIRSKLLKQNIWQYPAILSNYDQVKTFIATTNFTQNYSAVSKKK